MLFWLLWWVFLSINFTVLILLKNKPIYEPRVLFSLASLLWLVIGYGYSIGFENYLAFESINYKYSLDELAIRAMLLFILGYLSFIIGASIPKEKMFVYNKKTNYSVLKLVSIIFIFIAIANFIINVFLISNGNIYEYIISTAGRSYQIAEGKGISAVGYIFGFVGVNFIFYMYGKGEYLKRYFLLIFGLLILFIVIKLSQGRIFQTLVFIGSTYFSFLIGIRHKTGINTSYYKQLKVLFLLAIFGVSFYIMRIFSAFYYSGREINFSYISEFLSNFLHFALERGNVPNIPIVMTIIDKIPSEESYLMGTTLFNWLLWLIPKKILAGDYLISLWIKRTWYSDIVGGGLPPTAVGEWYANFGYAGVILGMLLIGFILRKLYNYAVVSENSFLAMIWANVSFGFIVIYPKTDLAQIPVFMLLVILIYYICYLFILNIRKVH